jgi:hypothetical protein
MNTDGQRHEATGALVYNSKTGQVRSSKKKGRVGRGSCLAWREEEWRGRLDMGGWKGSGCKVIFRRYACKVHGWVLMVMICVWRGYLTDERKGVVR